MKYFYRMNIIDGEHFNVVIAGGTEGHCNEVLEFLLQKWLDTRNGVIKHNDPDEDLFPWWESVSRLIIFPDVYSHKRKDGKTAHQVLTDWAALIPKLQASFPESVDLYKPIIPPGNDYMAEIRGGQQVWRRRSNIHIGIEDFTGDLNPMPGYKISGNKTYTQFGAPGVYKWPTTIRIPADSTPGIWRELDDREIYSYTVLIQFFYPKMPQNLPLQTICLYNKVES